MGVVRHAVPSLMEAAGKRFGGCVSQVCERSQDCFRDVYDHLMDCIATPERLRDTIATAIQVKLSIVIIEDSASDKCS